MIDDPTFERIRQYITGDLPAADQAATQAWIAVDAERLALYRECVELWALSAQVAPVVDEAAGLARIARILPAASSDRTPMRTRRKDSVRAPLRLGMILMVGAIVLAVVVGIRVHRPSPSDAIDTQTYTTKTGQRATIQLPDGSSVMLAPESQMHYARHEDGSRVVTLRGEGYFTVVSTQNHPFTVHTGRITTQVLGTAFDVRHNTAEDIVQVAVVTGKVVTRTSRGVTVLTPGNVARLTDSSTQVMSSDTRAITAWTDGRLTFTETPVPTMLRTLERWYGYRFRLADPALATGRVTTVFAINDSIGMMTALRDLLDVSMTFDGPIVTLHAHQATSHSAASEVQRMRRSLSIPPEAGK